MTAKSAKTSPASGIEISILVPVMNESGNIAPLVDEICAALAGRSFEIIYVDDASNDDSPAELAATAARVPQLRVLRHEARAGQSAAIRSALLASRGRLIGVLDGDGQNPPSEIPKLAAPLLEDATGRIGLVAGQRVDRQDTASKKLASRFANALRRTLLHDDTRDTGCGLKAFPRELFLQLPFFDHIHRYLPALVKREGREVALVDVSHRARDAGASNYTNIGRAMVGALDLVGVWWLIRRRKVAVVVSEDA